MGLDVLAVGVCTVDLIARVPVFPEPDGRMTMRDFSPVVGGNATIAAVALARLGARTGFAGWVGADLYGEQIRRSLHEDGVDTALLVTRDDEPTPTTVIISDEATCSRSIINHPVTGHARVAPTGAMLRAAEQARYVHLDHAAFPAVAAELLPRCRAAGVLSSFDAGVEVPDIEQFLPLLDIFVATRSQLAALTGEPDPHRALALLRAAGPPVVAATLGDEGSIGLDAGGALVVSPAFRVEVADTTGAGDVFHGAFLFALAQGWDMARTLRFANAAAALSCRAIGGRTGCPTLAQVGALLAGGGHDTPTT